MFAIPRRPATRPRGVTLVEMLVVVALVVLMMTILVQIFAATTGTMSASRTIQELDLSLRLLDQTIRQDLQGATARFTPPLNPAHNLGYFEYGENAPADFQGEDGDDFLAFTTRAPAGQVFTGRQWLIGSTGATANQSIQPTTITSRVAEVIYFLRNGNLYRRTFLVVPDRAKSISVGSNNKGYFSGMFGRSISVSWQGMNDISARPAGYSPGATITQIFAPIPNTLGDLSNRENRAFRPRFANDFHTTGGSATSFPDGVPDDFNGDDVPDYYPTLYYDGGANNGSGAGWGPNGHVRDGVGFSVERNQTAGALYDIYAFPFIYPGMYSVPADVNTARGWIHNLLPQAAANGSPGPINHSPLASGDLNLPAGNQTWFGFPTWRETMVGPKAGTADGWNDPITSPNKNDSFQSLGLRPFNPTVAPAANDPRFPPPVTVNGTQITPFGFDGAGSASFANPVDSAKNAVTTPGVIWEDDLVMTNVRSFDIKAFDPDATLYNVPGNPLTLSNGYHDLGYGATVRGSLVDGLDSTRYAANDTYFFQPFAEEPRGFGHEGRIPPRTSDYRPNPTRANLYVAELNLARNNGNPVNTTVYDVGDDSVGMIRLRRTFDTWSTDYTHAPESDIFLNGYPPAVPIYPSFPPPYPSALRGIQIQIRVVDPRNERVKVLTIRQDFTDKL